MNETKPCPKCGKTLPPDAPGGVCPKCLLAVGLDSLDDPGTEPTSGSSPAGQDPPATTVRYFGDYELLEEIARGGMGVVYKGRQVSLHRIVALKMILSGELAGEDDVERFHTEAQAAANLKHPNIVAIHEVGEHEGRYYFSMDYVEGQSLADVIQDGPLPARKAAEYLKTIAEAVHFAHQRGTLHRDLKPQNVLVNTDDQPLITDFGLAKRVEGDSGLTATGSVLGTPSYMPPEQATGRLAEVGPHSDVYSLGAILYELLTGRPPFRAASAVATLRQVTDNPPTAPHQLNDEVPPDLETICLKCLEKSPHVRYHSAHELAEELGRFLNHEPIQARPASAVRKVETWVRRQPWAITATAWMFVLGLVCMVYFQFQQNLLLQYQQAHPEYVREAGHRMEQLVQMESRYLCYGFILGLFGYMLYEKKSLRVTTWRQRWGGREPHPVSNRIRIVCALMSLSVLAWGVFLAAKTIETYVWEGADWKWTAFGIYSFSAVSLNQLVRLGQDYRQAVYGRQYLSDEQLEQMRESISNGDQINAIVIYRRAIPRTGLVEAKQFVDNLVTQVESEVPERRAASQQSSLPEPPQITVTIVVSVFFLCSVLTVALGLVMDALPLGLTVILLFGGFIAAVTPETMFAVKRFKKKSTRVLTRVGFVALGWIILLVGYATLAEADTSYWESVWVWIVGFIIGGIGAGYTLRQKR